MRRIYHRTRHGMQPARPQRRATPCHSTGKRRFPDHRAAVAALNLAATSRQLAEDIGHQTQRQECRSYFCEACKGHHLTSAPGQTVPAV